MKIYLDLLSEILFKGEPSEDRTGTGTISIFGPQLRPISVLDGFPLLTTKSLFFKGIMVELLWFLSGSTNIGDLHKHNVHFWDSWADKEGDLGRIYGYQLIRAEHIVSSWALKGKTPEELGYAPIPNTEFFRAEINQVQEVIQRLIKEPHSRRHVMTTWRAGDAHDLCQLSPCHGTVIQFYATEVDPFTVKKALEYGIYNFGISKNEWDEAFAKGGEDEIDRLVSKFLLDRRYMGSPVRKLHMKMYQRSADAFLGLPFNIASYSALLMMVAQVTGMIPDRFIWTGGDTHIYLDHIEAVQQQISRDPSTLPKLRINPEVTDIFQFTLDDFRLDGYFPQAHIPGRVSV